MGKGEEYYNKQHLIRMDAFVQQMYQMYLKVINEAARMGLSVNHDTSKPFQFSNYPGLSDRVGKMLGKYAGSITNIIKSGTKEEWLWADQKNDELVQKLFGNNPPEAVSKRFLGRNMQGLQAFQNRKVKGLDLSGRIWNQTQTLKSELEMAMDIGLLDGRSANKLSQDIRQFLNEPDKLFRRVRDARGILHLSKNAQNYNPGQGVYRSSFKNAQRVARTEINMAYRESDHDRWGSLDFVVGFEVRRSNNPFPCDVCENLKGKYPKNFLFRGWHPNCRCHAIPILASKDEMDKLEDMILDGDDTSGFKSANEIKSMPEDYVNWIDKNNKRLLRAKSTPYFIKDNYKNGDLRKGLTFAVKPTPKTVPILENGKLTRSIKSERDIDEMMNIYAAQYPEDFARGYQYTRVVHGEQYLMATYSDGRFMINDHKFPSINPYEYFTRAMNKIHSGEKLQFKEEYAIESFYHEILHNKAKGREALKQHFQGDYKRTAMEIVNQFVARHDYVEFLGRLGGKSYHQKKVLSSGLGYKEWVSRFRQVIKISKASETKVLADLRSSLINGRYSALDQQLSNVIRRISGVSWSNKEILHALERGQTDFDDLVSAIRAQVNNRQIRK